MKKIISLLIILFVCIFILSCSNQEEIKQKDKELHVRIDSLKCGETMEISAMNNDHVFKTFRDINHSVDFISFGDMMYEVRLAEDGSYDLIGNILNKKIHLYVKIFSRQVAPIGSMQFMHITKTCN